MNYLISKYISNMSLYDVQQFAISNDVYLSNQELNFIYNLVKNNYKDLLSSNGDISMYKDKFSDINYNKISKLVMYYKNKYGNYLK